MFYKILKLIVGLLFMTGIMHLMYVPKIPILLFSIIYIYHGIKNKKDN